MKLLDLKSSPLLRLLSKRKKPPQEPAVSAEALAALRALAKSADWSVYKLLLDLYVENSVKSMLSAAEDSQCHYLRGYITGLLHSVQIPEQLIAQADNSEGRNARAANTASRRRDSAKSALYATPGWGSGG